MKRYAIPALAADERMFKRLELPDEMEVLEWQQPFHFESLTSYADRLAEKLDTSGPVDLIGVSFGGILATELARRIPVNRLVLISAVKYYHEIPLYIRFWRKIPFYRWISDKNLNEWGNLIRPFFGQMQSGTKRLYSKMLEDTDPNLLRWSLHRLMEWENTSLPVTPIHIHGQKDIVFPKRKLKTEAKIIKGGEHYMILENPEAVSKALREALEE